MCRLDPKYCIFNSCVTKESAEEYVNILNPKAAYSKEEMVNAADNPTVVHCVNKPWKSLNAPLAKTWWEYAKKSDFYDQIVAFGSNFK